jgi:tetratricopeptide (TPR) repeat protein
MSDLKALIDEAAACCNHQECEAAILVLESAAQLAPDSWWIQYQLGFCCAGGCRRHSLADPDVALYHFHNALSLFPEPANQEERASILAALGNTYLVSRQLPLQARVTAAVECQEKAAAIYESRGRLDEWARAQYNLGNAWCEFPQESFPEKWQHAIQHYTEALRVWTRDRDSVRHGKTLQNLGTAYRELPTGNRELNIRLALNCYREALRAYHGEQFRRENASIHNNLGTAFLSLPAQDSRRSARHAQMALRHFERALCVLCKEGAPSIYAITQFNRGQALLRLAAGEHSPERLLRRAHLSFLEARNAFLLAGQATLAESAWERLQIVAAFLAKLGSQQEPHQRDSSQQDGQENSPKDTEQVLGGDVA